jgi:isochorismate synthase
MAAWALYRLPHADHYVRIRQTSGEPEALLSCAQLNGREGFVVAPFDIRPDQPVLLIRPDAVEAYPLPGKSGLSVLSGKSGISSPSPSYAVDFANFHAQLLSGTFRKIVLARCADETTAEPVSPEALFLKACQRYPRMFIALVYTSQTGYWLTATPEILLDNEGQQWRTIALAGTMKLEADQLQGEGETVTWSTKNIQEQRYVATYITECLERFVCDFHEEGPRTVRAANLVHLRSDFTFMLPDTDHLGDLLQTLHPTPAVCGLPKRDACRFILSNEHTPRHYYSGFMGPLDAEGDTNLYVSLRCMKIEGDDCYLYAGGGLLRESTEEQEWQETEAKMETMRRLLQTEK